MASGLPCIVTRTGGLPAALKNGELGIIVEPGDAQSLAEVILGLLDDETLAKHLGKRAREEVMTFYSCTKVARVFEEIYETLVR
jgi:glycosyltransferase involved in cell wall biosynthesis